MTDVSDALAEGETVRDRLALRTGGSVALTDDHLFVVTDAGAGADADPEITRVALDDVAEVTVEDVDYFLAILSVLLAGYGLYSVPRNAALGLAFAAFGGLSLYWTYRKRGKARIEVAGRPKPISVFPEDTGAFVDGLQPFMAGEADDAGDEADGN